MMLGPAGTSGLGYEEGLRKCKELGLEALEVEFTYGVKMPVKEAARIGALAKKLNIKLSVHAPYYINLNSKENAKAIASVQRILQSCERAHFLGANPVVVHAGFYQDMSAEETFNNIKKKALEIIEKIKEKKWDTSVAFETTGKKSQFAGLDELLRLRQETGCAICVDFAHLYAREQGIIDYDDIFGKIKSLIHVHAHFSGINFGPKGEKNHIPLEKAFAMPLLRAIQKYKKDITIIIESPDPWADCVKMKEWIREIGGCL